ncbi:MAG: cation-translocating P-type ATPase [Acidimicrobiia bacterium]
MSETEHTTDAGAADTADWFLVDGDEVVARLGGNRDEGLSAQAVAERLGTYGPNELESEPPPSIWQIAFKQVIDPMNIMLIAVAVVSLLLGEISTGVLVALLVLLNVVLGARQEMKAKAAVDALAKLQVPMTRVRRDGGVQEVAATGLVPGDIVLLEAGDLVPADGRILRSATLETQEAALTGESAPIPKDAGSLADPKAALGDRTCMVYQNTSVTRGTATVVITETGMDTEMGRIATMLSSVERTRSPLQRELDGLTKVLGTIAWGAVAIIVLIGLGRGLEFTDVMLLGTAMAISAIPTGLPTFVQGMLSYGSKQLAEAQAVVKNLTDVETLGSTSAINSDKTGTLTMNEMMASRVYHDAAWFQVEGSGYGKTGAIRAVAGEPEHDFTALGYGLVLCSDATVSDEGDVIGDPTEAALVVLAAKLGIDAEETRRAYPRLAEVPFDSSYKFMATVHRVVVGGQEQMVLLTKGAPDVVVGKCTMSATVSRQSIPIGDVLDDVEAANARLGSEGLRVLAIAARFIPPEEEAAALADPMAFVADLRLSALIGIIDPLRPSSRDAVHVAQRAGIEVRMITGDHVATAQAIGKELGLPGAAINGAEFREMSDVEVMDDLHDLSVFGRVTPEDKLRLVQMMQADGMVVAMTGDAVNDAAALKQADIGVAMGSGSEVTKQAAKMILTDDNFGTLVHAIRLGRSIYEKIVLYVRYQMSQLLSLVILFLAASLFNIASGVALTPMMVLFLNFLVASFPVVVIMLEPVHPGLMQRPPREPSVPLTNRPEVIRWLIYGTTLFLMTMVPLLWGPDTPSASEPSVSMTMAFAVMAFGTLATGLAVRRDPEFGLLPPVLKALGILAIPAALTVIATHWNFLKNLLGTTELNGDQWLGAMALATVVFVVVELEKWIRHRRHERTAGEGVAPDASDLRAPVDATVQV